MPRAMDSSYNQILTKPSFFDEQQREEYLQKKIMDEILEPSIPPLPTRQMELDYMEKLESEFKHDRWLHTRFRKMQAGPFRRPYIQTRALKQRYRRDYSLNFLLGVIIISPFAIFIGRKMRLGSSGVPALYFPRSFHRFPNLNPDHYAKNYFRMGFWSSLFIGGNVMASFMTPIYDKDAYYSRPDFKPSAPMVEDTDDIKKAKREMMEVEYGMKDHERKKSILYRLFRPNQADYNVWYKDRRENSHELNTYDPKVGGFPNASRMHEHHW
jgi:hypothetical protein